MNEEKESLQEKEQVNKQNEVENKQDNKENIIENKEENKQDSQENSILSVSENSSSDENVSKNENEILNYNLEEFNTIVTTEGNLRLNEEIYMQMKTTNLYLNLILLAITTCFLYYVVSKALKKLFYINI